MDFNPDIRNAIAPANTKGGADSIERPNNVVNVEWQTRAAAPTPAEAALAEALGKIFADEVYELAAIVERLNAASVLIPSGTGPWTEDRFRSELARLAE
jgi:hypothetical protein